MIWMIRADFPTYWNSADALVNAHTAVVFCVLRFMLMLLFLHTLIYLLCPQVHAHALVNAHADVIY